MASYILLLHNFQHEEKLSSCVAVGKYFLFIQKSYKFTYIYILKSCFYLEGT